MEQIQGVIFDMGDILYDASGWRRWLAQRLVELGVDIDYQRLVVRWEARLVPVYLGQMKYWDAFGKLLDEFALEPGDVEQIAGEAAAQGQSYSQSHEPFPGIAEGLSKLASRGIRLAVLSDTEAREPKVRAKLKRFDLEHYFDAVVTSIDIGAVKPMPEAFDCALAAIEAPANRAAFVAHDEDELAGALAHGLYTIAFNASGAVPADVHAKDFSAVVESVLRR